MFFFLPRVNGQIKHVVSVKNSDPEPRKLWFLDRSIGMVWVSDCVTGKMFWNPLVCILYELHDRGIELYNNLKWLRRNDACDACVFWWRIHKSLADSGTRGYARIVNLIDTKRFPAWIENQWGVNPGLIFGILTWTSCKNLAFKVLVHSHIWGWVKTYYYHIRGAWTFIYQLLPAIWMITGVQFFFWFTVILIGCLFQIRWFLLYYCNMFSHHSISGDKPPSLGDLRPCIMV